MSNENGTQILNAEQAFPILQQGNRHYKLDIPNKRITFLDKRFYYTESGKAVPSVTTILEAYPKGAAFFEWLKQQGENADEVRDEAGRRGSNVHRLTEDYDKGSVVSLLTDSGEISMSTMEWNMFEKYVQFRNTNQHLACVEIEQNVVDEDLGYGGTKDRIFAFNGKRILIDLKTSNSVHEYYWLQLAAYKKAHNKKLMDADPTGKLLKEGYIDDVAILWLNSKHRTDKPMKEGTLMDCQGKGWCLILREQSDQLRDWNLFKATQMLWIAQNESVVPREVSYQLAHQFVANTSLSEDEAAIAAKVKTGKGPKG